MGDMPMKMRTTCTERSYEVSLFSIVNFTLLISIIRTLTFDIFYSVICELIIDPYVIFDYKENTIYYIFHLL